MIFGSVRSAKKCDRKTPVTIYDTDFLLSQKSLYSKPPLGIRNIEHLKLSKEELNRMQESGVIGFSRESMLSVLPSSTNAWSVQSKCVDADESFIKEMRGILNKITPQKYVEIICKTDLGHIYTSAERMTAVVKLIFDKALQEPSYAHLYVELSKDILSFASLPEKGLEFRRQIIQQAQHEFEIASQSVDCSSTNAKTYKRQASNMRFIGELYIADIINSNTVVFICGTLLHVNEATRPTSSEIELLAAIMPLVGKKLKKEEGSFLDTVPVHLKRAMETSQYPPRIRFLIMDILDAHLDNWEKK